MVGNPHDMRQVPLTGDIDEKDILWEDPEYSAMFEAGQWLIMRQNALSMDPTLSTEETTHPEGFGVLDYEWSEWKIQLNWTLNWQGRIPPNHMAIYWKGTHMGTISPWLTIRQCWNCRAAGLVKVPKGDIGVGILKEMGLPPDTRWVPRVLPAHPCPHCKHMDWIGRTVDEHDFQVACAEEMARVNAQDDLFHHFAPKNKPDHE